MKRRWSDEDRQRFGDGDRLRASSVPGRRKTGPSADEWAEDLCTADVDPHPVEGPVYDYQGRLVCGRCGSPIEESSIRG